MWELIWKFANSPLGLSILGTVVLFILNYIYAKKPASEKYEGAIIEAIKLAEKSDLVQGNSKATMAFSFVSDIVSEYRKKKLSKKESIEIKEGIKKKHAELEAAGLLSKKPSNQ